MNVLQPPPTPEPRASTFIAQRDVHTVEGIPESAPTEGLTIGLPVWCVALRCNGSTVRIDVGFYFRMAATPSCEYSEE